MAALTDKFRNSEMPQKTVFDALILSFRQPFSFVTSDVVEATCQCLLAQAEEAESHKLSQEETEGMIIGEFGRCLKQIIDMANKAAAGIKATGNADG